MADVSAPTDAAAPAGSDAERMRLARVVNVAFLLLTALFALIYSRRGLDDPVFLVHAVAFLGGAGVLGLTWLGLKPIPASYVLAALLSAILVTCEIVDGGPSAANLSFFVLVPLAITFVCGARHGLVWCGLSIACLGALLLAALAGLIPPYVASSRFSDALAPFATTIVVAAFTFAYDQYRDRMQAALGSARATAERASRLKSELVATMSHELRTPMNGILGMVRELERTELSSAQREIVDVMSRASHALAHVVDDVLDMERIGAGGLPLRDDAFDARMCLKEASAIVSPLAREKGVALAERIDDTVPRLVHGDAARVRQVVVNVLGNAVKFTEAGSVTATLEGAAGSLSFVIDDTGPGFTPEVLARPFTPFARGGVKNAGAGLGLAISKSLVDAMSGEMTIENRPPGGARVRIRLPLREAQHAAAQERSEHERGHRILIVEDNPVNERVALLMLRAAGARCSVARDGNEALLRLEAEPFDLVFMDCRMPGLDGLETTRRLRAREVGRRTPVVAMTASTLVEDRLACVAAGMDGWVPKPLDPEALASVLARFAPRRD